MWRALGLLGRERMSVGAFDGVGHRRYSTAGLRSLISMVGRRAFRKVNGTATGVFVKPLVVMAARVLGPGPTRLRLVKLAHHLGQNAVVVQPEGRFDERPQPAAQPTRRAA
jgi:hypothetical protein